VINRHSNLK